MAWEELTDDQLAAIAAKGKPQSASDDWSRYSDEQLAAIAAKKKPARPSAASMAAGLNMAGEKLQPVHPSVDAAEDLLLTPLVSAPFMAAGTALGGVPGGMAGQIGGGMVADYVRTKINQALSDSAPGFQGHIKESFINNLVGTVLGEGIFRGVPATVGKLRGEGVYAGIGQKAGQLAESLSEKAIGEETEAQATALMKRTEEAEEVARSAVEKEEISQLDARAGRYAEADTLAKTAAQKQQEENIKALALQQEKAQKAQEAAQAAQAKLDRETPTQVEQIRADAQKKLTPAAQEELVSTEAGWTRDQANAAPDTWMETGPGGATLPSEAKVAAVQEGRDAVFYNGYRRLSGDLTQQYTGQMKTHGATPVLQDELSPLKDAITEEMKYSATTGRTFGPEVQKMFGRVRKMTTPQLPGGMSPEEFAAHPPQVQQAILSHPELKPPPPVTANEVFTLQSEIGEKMQSGGLSGTDKSALQALHMAAHSVLENKLPIPPKLAKQYALMKNYYDRSFFTGVRDATNPAAGAAHLLKNPESAQFLVANQTPAEKAVTRKAISELYFENPKAVIDEANAPVFKLAFGENSPLAKRGVLRYTDGKIEAVGTLFDSSPAAKARLEGLVTNEAQAYHEELARTAVGDVKNWIGDLPRAQGAQLKRELAALPNDIARADRIADFWRGDVPTQATDALAQSQMLPETAGRTALAEKYGGGVTTPDEATAQLAQGQQDPALAGPRALAQKYGQLSPPEVARQFAQQQRDPKLAGPEGIAKGFPGGITPRTNQPVPPARTKEEAMTQAVRMAPKGVASSTLMNHMRTMLPVYSALTVYHGITGNPSAWALEMTAIGGASSFTHLLRNGFAKKMEGPEGAKFVNAMLNPGTDSSLKTIARAAFRGAVKVGVDQMTAPRSVSPPPPPPEAPLPETPKKERIDTIKEIRAGIQEGGAPVNVTTDLHAGRVTIDDLREQLAPPPMPGG